MQRVARGLVGALACALVGACALPRGAPLEREVLARADEPLAGFALYPVTGAFLPTLAAWPQVNERHLGWIGAGGGSSQRLIAVNDTIDLTIYDNDENSLLLRPGERQTQLRGLRVSSGGSVFLPYVGAVNVAGATPESARERLQRAIEPIAPSAQVQLTFAEGRQNAVEAVAGVSQPGLYPLPDRSLTVLGLIALGGGVPERIANPQVRLQRGGALYGVSLDRLYEEPGLDTLLRPGDQVIVEQESREFVVFGAAGREQVVLFPRDEVTALDAVALAGGLDDRRANPEGVLILRTYPREALAAGLRGPREPRVVFAIDLTSADGLFSAGEFRIAPRDVVVVTESAVTATATVADILGELFGVSRQVTQLGG